MPWIRTPGTIQNASSFRFCLEAFSRIVGTGLSILGLGLGTHGETFVGVHGPLHVNGSNIVDKAGSRIVSRGMSLYCWSPAGTQFFNASAIEHFARDWKCTLIRVTILPRAYKRNAELEIKHVNTVVDACIANGIYAVIDWHSMEGAQKDVEASVKFFTTIAEAYGNTPNVIYELWNEPVQESWATIKQYHEAVISKIRAVDPDNIIICGSRHWDQECEEASLNPITTSTNIAYSIHFYSATHKQKLRDNGSRAMKNGIALFCTEYGLSSATGGGEFDPVEARRWWSWLDSNFISSANWSAAALEETSAAFKPGASATGPWTDEMLKPSGLAVREYLKRKYEGPSKEEK